MENPLEETMPRWLTTPFLLPLAFALGCPASDTDVHALEPVLVVAPDELDFGEVVVDYSSELTVELINSGKATLKVSAITWTEGTTGVFDKDLESVEVPRDERVTLTVSCLPTTYDVYTDTIVITSDDPENSEVQVPVSCTGTHAPTPDISLEPTSIDFGDVEVGEVGTTYVTLSNVGDGDLLVAGTGQSGSGAFAIVTDPEGTTISPDGDQYVIIVNYEPTDVTGDYGLLQIVSNDPDEPAVDLIMLGNCESADDCEYEYPVAVIEGNEESDPLETFTLDGSASYDPRGQEIEYSWALTDVPAGSGGHVSSVVDDHTDLYVDIAGDYQVQLVVINESGVASAPTKHNIAVLPSDDIHVEMFWYSGDSDLDLHLAQEDAPIFLDPTDCNYCNPNPDWGTEGQGSDDPSLDLDDVSGYGPENITINAPADGGYDVHVHYFRDSGAGAVVATAKIWIEGSVAYEVSETMEYDDRWFVGTIRWPDNVVAENEGEPIINGGHRGCYEED